MVFSCGVSILDAYGACRLCAGCDAPVVMGGRYPHRLNLDGSLHRCPARVAAPALPDHVPPQDASERGERE